MDVTRRLECEGDRRCKGIGDSSESVGIRHIWAFSLVKSLGEWSSSA